MLRHLAILTLVLLFCGYVGAAEPGTALAAEAESTLRKAVDFYRTQVSCEGGYLWQYAADLSAREGEGSAGETTVWVQPPGTPTVGDAYLHAYKRTGDTYYLEAARETALALVKGQLQSGGWHYSIYFDPADRAKYAYRADGNTSGSNTSTLDDNTTQAALRNLMAVDKALDFEDSAIHEAALYAVEKLLAAQYPNGAWPQRFTGPPDPSEYPVKPASYPDEWPRTYPGGDYKAYYTFNDGTIVDMIETMFDAAEVYGDERCREAALKCGEFILLAQMPEPQPAWAQQYDRDMHPAWARKFEPPAITGGESQGIILALTRLYARTNDKRFIESARRAYEYLDASRLEDGRIPRFLELKTNKPLYFTKDYELTYSNADMPTHYAFITGWGLEGLGKRLARLDEGEWAVQDGLSPVAWPARKTESVRRAISSLDERGAWVESGSLRRGPDTVNRIITMRSYAANIRLLSDCIAAAQSE